MPELPILKGGVEMSGELEYHTLSVTAFESGVMLAILWESEHAEYVGGAIRQLVDIARHIQEKAGVRVVEKRPDGKLELRGSDGTIIIRERYPWEYWL